MSRKTDQPILSVRNLRVRFAIGKAPVDALRSVSFQLGAEKLGIVGESGSGKSTLGRALLKLLPAVAQVRADHLTFVGQDLLAASERDMLAIRGRRIGMILQDPKYSLDPTMRVGEQVREAVTLHQGLRGRAAKEQVIAMLDTVQIRNPRRVYDLYAHEISGGMGQRIMIATALAGTPELIIADEPTSALDVTVRRQLLELLDQLVTERGIGLIFITHDLDLAEGFCDRLLIMYAGQVVETLAAAELRNATHPYTRGLLASLPRLDQPVRRLPVLSRDPEWRRDLSQSIRS
jgi:peptide/nickel transport system ATP-binding protein